jgi:hypothetical protein
MVQLKAYSKTHTMERHSCHILLLQMTKWTMLQWNTLYSHAMERHSCHIYIYFPLQSRLRFGLGLWCLTPLSTIFQLHRGGQFLLVKEIGLPTDYHRHAASNWQTLSHNVVSSTSRLSVSVIQIRSRPRRPLKLIW